MVFEYELTYFDCQSCQSRVHCKQCSEKVADALGNMPEVKILDADIEKKRLRLDMDEDTEDDVIDALEEHRFFAL